MTEFDEHGCSLGDRFDPQEAVLSTRLAESPALNDQRKSPEEETEAPQAKD